MFRFFAELLPACSESSPSWTIDHFQPRSESARFHGNERHYMLLSFWSPSPESHHAFYCIPSVYVQEGEGSIRKIKMCEWGESVSKEFHTNICTLWSSATYFILCPWNVIFSCQNQRLSVLNAKLYSLNSKLYFSKINELSFIFIEKKCSPFEETQKSQKSSTF